MRRHALTHAGCACILLNANDPWVGAVRIWQWRGIEIPVMHKCLCHSVASVQFWGICRGSTEHSAPNSPRQEQCAVLYAPSFRLYAPCMRVMQAACCVPCPKAKHTQAPLCLLTRRWLAPLPIGREKAHIIRPAVLITFPSIS